MSGKSKIKPYKSAAGGWDSLISSAKTPASKSIPVTIRKAR